MYFRSGFRVRECSLSAEGGELIFSLPFDEGAKTYLKTLIPSSHRSWDNERKAWRVDPQYGNVLVDIARRYFSQDLELPQVTTNKLTEVTVTIRAKYVGRCKQQGDASLASVLFMDNSWGAVIPESVLRTWFHNDAKPGQQATLYAVLGVAPKSSTDDITKAYRRLAKTTHPDVNHEPDAAEQFKAVKRAYDALKDPDSRSRYDVGLLLQATLPPQEQNAKWGYRSPLRCGEITVTAVERLGKLVVGNIVSWFDIVNSRGQVLASSWPQGSDEVVAVYV